MPGPLVHRASARVMDSMLSGVFNMRVLPTSYMKPDIEEKLHPGTHPGYNAVAMSGNLVDVVVDSVEKMCKLLIAGKKSDASELAQYVQHLICDAHMITQIVPDLIKHDGKMDTLAELVGNKDGGCSVEIDIAEVKQLTFKEALERSIKNTVERYEKPFRKNRFLFVLKYLGPMTRRCVEKGAFFGVWFVRLSKGDWNQ